MAAYVYLQVQPGMVVMQNLQRTGTGRYTGDDLPLVGKLQGTLKRKSLDLHIAGALGPVNLTLVPVELDNPEWFEQELAGGGNEPPRYVEPTPQPTPTPQPKPRPRPRPTGTGCGSAGQEPCANVLAQKAGKAQKLGCPGKNSYFSTLRGGSCWTCPKNYKRTSLTRRMDHPKACKKRKSLSGPWQAATYQKRAWGCPAGQFHVSHGGGTCMSCPAGYKRIHVAGVDTMQCKPTKRCNAGLRVAKQPPEKNPLANLLGATSAKVCAPRFDIKAAAKRDIDGFGILPNLMKNLAAELLKSSQQRERKSLKKLFKAKKWREAYDYLNAFAAFRAFMQTVQESGNRSISIGWAGDVQLIVGGSGEVGIAIDLTTKTLKPYESAGISKGLSVGIDGAVNLGVWKGSFESGYAQGFTASVSTVASVGGGVWYSYYNQHQGQERLLGVTVAAGAGIGVEIGEYNEVGTWLLKEVFERL